MTLPSGQAPFDCVEVRFKMEEKSFIAILKITLSMETLWHRFSGHVGIVALTGELVRIK
jgi:hypothetical protein